MKRTGRGLPINTRRGFPSRTAHRRTRSEDGARTRRGGMKEVAIRERVRRLNRRRGRRALTPQPRPTTIRGRRSIARASERSRYWTRAKTAPPCAFPRNLPPADYRALWAPPESPMAQPQTNLTPPELAVEVSRILAGAGIEHALGGALALGFHAEPRGTLDVDLNIFVDADAPGEALDALSDGGIAIERRAAIAIIASRGDLFLRHRGCRLDLFFNSIPFHARAASRTRTVNLLGARVPILSAEDLIVLQAPVQPPQGHCGRRTHHGVRRRYAGRPTTSAIGWSSAWTTTIRGSARCAPCCNEAQR